MIHVGLQHFLVVSAILFALGLVCVLTRRNAVALLIGIELMLIAAGLNLLAFNHFNAKGLEGPIFVLFIIALAAAEAVVGLALIIAIHRQKRSIDVEHHDSLRG